MNALNDPFAANLAKVFGEHLLQEKWLLAPSLRVGNQWVDRVAWLGGPVLNVRVKTLRSLMSELAAPKLEQLGLERLPDRGAILLVERVFNRLRPQLGYLGTLELSSSLAAMIHHSLKSLRVAGLTPLDLPSSCFEVASKSSDIARLLAAYESRLEELQHADTAQLQRLALASMEENHQTLAAGVVVLLPASLELQSIEQQLIALLGSERVVRIPDPCTGRAGSEIECDRELLSYASNPSSAPAPIGDGTVTFFAALGEVNEVREVLRRTSSEGRKLDQIEVLYTCSSTYVPLFYEVLMELEEDLSQAEIHTPVTFAEGLPCRYSRPGKALQAWAAWIQAGYPQATLVKMIRDVLLETPPIVGDEMTAEDGPGFVRIGAALSAVGISAGRDRYLPQIDARLAALQRQAAGDDPVDDEEEESSGGPAAKGQLPDRIRSLTRARALVAQVLENTPANDASAPDALGVARQFLDNCARTTTELDHYARKKLLEEIDEQARWIMLEKDALRFDVTSWLAALPARTNVMGSGPRPGCIHVAPLLAGGHSGRQRTFLIGLDDRRFPRSDRQDPLLLDSERRKLSHELLTQQDHAQGEARELGRLLSRLGGHLTFSYSTRNLADESELYPSPALLGLYRLVSGHRELDLTGLQRALAPELAAFAPRDPHHALDATEAWVSILAGSRDTDSGDTFDGDQILQAKFPHLHRGREAVNHRLRAGEVTAEDGVVPEAGVHLDPGSDRGGSVSASSLEAAGKCARRYFFRYGLVLSKPGDLEINPEEWLDRLQQGRLLHRVFEDFFRALEREEQKPRRELHQELLYSILEAQTAKFLRLYPPPNESAYRRQRRELRRAADTFLAEEEVYFQTKDAKVSYLEASLGMKQRGHRSTIDCETPVPIDLGNSLQIRLRGRVDRIDLLGGDANKTYMIWDYKTGSPTPYAAKEVLASGRVLQPILYAAMVESRLQELAASPTSMAGFGFFFPGAAGMGKRIEWTRDQLDEAKATVLRIRETIRTGRFLATTDAKECRYCDYQAICRADGPLADVTEASKTKQTGPGGAPAAGEESDDDELP